MKLVCCNMFLLYRITRWVGDLIVLKKSATSNISRSSLLQVHFSMSFALYNSLCLWTC